MCGHVGVAGNLYGKDLSVMRELLWADAVRGLHSTGIAMVAPDRKISIIKHKGSPMQVFADENWSKEFTMQKRVMIGHNRYATVGDQTKENAHPFAHGNIVGAHNGTLDYRGRTALVDEELFGTDSEALYYNIASFGVEEVVPLISGAWALVWYDSSNDSLNFLRNDQRPLCYTFNEAGNVIYWASEPEMLRWILHRNDVRHGPICSVKVDTWLRFAVPATYQKWGDPVITEVKGRPPFVSSRDREVPWETESDAWAEWAAQGWTPPHQQSLKLGPETIGGKTESESSAGSNVVWLQKQKQEEERQKGSAGRKGSSKNTPTLQGLPSTNKSKLTPPEQAFFLGAEAGEKGWSEVRNPYCPKKAKALHKEWLDGRRFALTRLPNAPKEVSKPANEFKPSPDKSLPIKGFNGELLSAREFEQRTKGLCSWRGCDIDAGDKVRWFSRSEVVCEKCVNGDQEFLANLRA